MIEASTPFMGPKTINRILQVQQIRRRPNFRKTQACSYDGSLAGASAAAFALLNRAGIDE